LQRRGSQRRRGRSGVATTDVEDRSRRKFGGIEIIARDKKLFTATEKKLLLEVAGWRLSASAINSSTNDHSVGPLNSNFSRTVATKAANSTLALAA